MKQTTRLLITAAFVLAAVLVSINSAQAANLTAAWDYTGDITAVDDFKVYEQNGANVTIVATAPKTATVAAPLTAQIANVNPGVHTYFVTASNSYWGESARSNTASTPAATIAPGQFKVKVTTTGPLGRAGVTGKWIESLAITEAPKHGKSGK